MLGSFYLYGKSQFLRSSLLKSTNCATRRCSKKKIWRRSYIIDSNSGQSQSLFYHLPWEISLIYSFKMKISTSKLPSRMPKWQLMWLFWRLHLLFARGSFAIRLSLEWGRVGFPCPWGRRTCRTIDGTRYILARKIVLNWKAVDNSKL